MQEGEYVVFVPPRARPFVRLHHLLAIGLGWGVVLWLQVVGIDATVPNLALAGLASHALGGAPLESYTPC